MSDDDILYWLVSDMTREMASEFELSHRSFVVRLSLAVPKHAPIGFRV